MPTPSFPMPHAHSVRDHMALFHQLPATECPGDWLVEYHAKVHNARPQDHEHTKPLTLRAHLVEYHGYTDRGLLTEDELKRHHAANHTSTMGTPLTSAHLQAHANIDNPYREAHEQLGLRRIQVMQEASGVKWLNVEVTLSQPHIEALRDWLADEESDIDGSPLLKGAFDRIYLALPPPPKCAAPMPLNTGITCICNADHVGEWHQAVLPNGIEVQWRYPGVVGND